MRNVRPGLLQELVEQRIHGLLAVRIARIVAQENVMLHKEEIVLAAIQEDQTVLQDFVVGCKLLPKQGPACLADDVFLDVSEDLRHQLPDQPQHIAPRRLHLRQPRLDDMCRLAALKELAALAHVFFAIQDHVGELVLQLAGDELQDGQPEEQVNLDVLLMLGAGQRALQQLRQELAEGRGVHRPGVAELDARKVGAAGVLADEVEEVVARHLNEFGAEEHVVVDVVHPDGERPHR